MIGTIQPRRDFLRQLCKLPMLGGGVALLGAPTAVAEPITGQLLDGYRSFLWGELGLLDDERPREFYAPYGERPDVPHGHPVHLEWAQQVVDAHYERVRRAKANHEWTMAKPTFRALPSTRAALVLSAVGFDWKLEERADESSRNPNV